LVRLDWEAKQRDEIYIFDEGCLYPLQKRSLCEAYDELYAPVTDRQPNKTNRDETLLKELNDILSLIMN